MLKKILTTVILFFILFYPQPIPGENHRYIEIFDPKQDKVVKVVQANKEINSMVEDWINRIDNIYAKIDPIKDDGYAIRFPLDPVIQVRNKWLNTIVQEVFLIIPEKDPPFFIIFETESRAVCFPFIGEITVLSNILDFKLK